MKRQVEGGEQQDDADIGEQPFEDAVAEEREVDADDQHDHRKDIEDVYRRPAHPHTPG